MKTIESAWAIDGDTIPAGSEWHVGGGAEGRDGARRVTEAPTNIRIDIT